MACGAAEQILCALDHHNVQVFPQVRMNGGTFLALTVSLGEKHDDGVTEDNSEASGEGIFRIALENDDQVRETADVKRVASPAQY